jgi:hypothetical protein
MNMSLPLQLFDDTLLLIPCSGDKERGSRPSRGLSILSKLTPARAAALANARAALRERALVDEGTLMPAYLRYSGQFYSHASTAVGRALAAGQRVVIVSGGYGLLLGDEPIGMYEKPFTLSDWPRSRASLILPAPSACRGTSKRRRPGYSLAKVWKPGRHVRIGK